MWGRVKRVNSGDSPRCSGPTWPCKELNHRVAFFTRRGVLRPSLTLWIQTQRASSDCHACHGVREGPLTKGKKGLGRPDSDNRATRSHQSAQQEETEKDGDQLSPLRLQDRVKPVDSSTLLARVDLGVRPVRPPPTIHRRREAR